MASEDELSDGLFASGPPYRSHRLIGLARPGERWRLSWARPRWCSPTPSRMQRGEPDQPKVNRSGQRVVLSPRIGAEMPIFPTWLKARGGSYLEPTRFDTSTPRIHGTFGPTSCRTLRLLWKRKTREIRGEACRSCRGALTQAPTGQTGAELRVTFGPGAEPRAGVDVPVAADVREARTPARGKECGALEIDVRVVRACYDVGGKGQGGERNGREAARLVGRAALSIPRLRGRPRTRPALVPDEPWRSARPGNTPNCAPRAPRRRWPCSPCACRLASQSDSCGRSQLACSTR